MRKSPAHKADAAFAWAFCTPDHSLSARGRGGEAQRTDLASTAKEPEPLLPIDKAVSWPISLAARKLVTAPTPRRSRSAPQPARIAVDQIDPLPPAASKPRQRRTGTGTRRRRKARGGPLQRWRDRMLRAWELVNAVPPVVLTAVLLVLLAGGVVAANFAHQVARKPTELLMPVSDALAKTPTGTWRHYGPLFTRYSTAIVGPELLAALAQTESQGNPAAHTYWRWSPEAADLFDVYRPASSSVGMYQMTDPAFADAQRYCIRHHAVVAAGSAADSDACGTDGLYSRIDPGRAIELTAVYLDHGVTRVLGRLGAKMATAQQKQDTAAVLHLCGAGPAKRFARQGFHLVPGQRCGDHDPADYLAQVTTLERTFRHLASGVGE